MKRIVILIFLLLISCEIFALSDTQIYRLSMMKTETVFAQDPEIGRVMQTQEQSEMIMQILEDFFLSDLTEVERGEYLHEDTQVMVEVLYGEKLYSLLPGKDLRIGVSVDTEDIRIPFRLFLDEFNESDSMTGMVFLVESEKGWKIAHIEMNIS